MNPYLRAAMMGPGISAMLALYSKQIFSPEAEDRRRFHLLSQRFDAVQRLVYATAGWLILEHGRAPDEAVRAAALSSPHCDHGGNSDRRAHHGSTSHRDRAHTRPTFDL